METKTISTTCCIAGGGPAGIVLGYLLARAGVKVTVLEKWPDFFRDFRGDTIHPSTMEVLYELGLLEDFLKLPHSETTEIKGYIGGQEIKVVDFSHLKVHCPFVAFIPQWDFLNFIAAKAKAYPQFKLLMETEATDLIGENGKVAGVKAKSKSGEFNIRAEVVIGADGRHSAMRDKSGFKAKTLGSPIDVLWFRVSRKKSDPEQSLGNVDGGRILVMLNRDDYWQCGFVIRKGQFTEIKAAGLESFREDLQNLVPYLSKRVNEIDNWDLVKLLSVTIDHLDQWYKPGLLFLGDAAHAMSPIGGIGINLAIQDAVAAANVLLPAFKKGKVGTEDFQAVQNRRQAPTLRTQNVQVFLQNQIISRALKTPKHMKLPLIFKLVRRFPVISRLPARFIGLGFQPEHISPNLFK